MTGSEIKKRFKVKSIDDYKSKCEYTRCLLSKSSNSKIIQYTINNPSRMYINPQYVNVD